MALRGSGGEGVRLKGELILASTSPRRRRLLAEAGYRFRSASPLCEEAGFPPGADPELSAARAAEAKAASVASRLAKGVVIGADTIVVLAGEIIGKPADRADARRILGRLSGSTHRVVTGVCVIDAASGRRLSRTVSTEVVLGEMSASEIDRYVESGESDGKAGAYAIQESGDRFVKELRGSLTNVVGLPMEALREMLLELKETSNG